MQFKLIQTKINQSLIGFSNRDGLSKFNIFFFVGQQNDKGNKVTEKETNKKGGGGEIGVNK